jgi:hypothetical protein
MASNYPPGVTGNEPEIVGCDESDTGKVFDFGAAIAQLARLRTDVAEAKEEKARLARVIQETKGWKDADRAESVAAPLVVALEDELSKAAAAHWLASADKHPLPR